MGEQAQEKTRTTQNDKETDTGKRTDGPAEETTHGGAWHVRHGREERRKKE